MGIGRVLCVALPFILTSCSIICMLVVCLAGVGDKNLYMFNVDITDLGFDPQSLDLTNLISGSSDNPLSDLIPRAPEAPFEWHDARFLERDEKAQANKNITVADLSLPVLYDVSLWGYCYTEADGDRHCNDPEWDWAHDIYNDTLTDFTSATVLAGQNISFPSDIEDALKAYATVSKWTQIAYVIAIVSLGVELFFGIFASCSRIFGCITFLVAGVAAVLVCVAVSLSTATAVIVVGAVEATAQFYGVRASFNNNFLAVAWVAAAFAIGAAFFWMFTICCCASSHTSSKRGFSTRSVGDDQEKILPAGSYQPLGEQHEMSRAPFYNSSQQYGGNRQSVGNDMAYEPYSHARG